MRKILLSINLLLISAATFGQSTFTNMNEPTIGESRTLYLCDSNAVDYASTTGNGVTWNYGLTSTYAGQTRLLSIIDASTTPYAADFPGSTTTAVIQDFISTFLSTDASGRTSQGYLIESVDFGIVKAKFSNDAEKLMTYPFALNGQVSDIFSGNLSFTYQSVPQNPACTGNVNVKYDGFGTLVQVNNVSVPNVARVHLRDTTFATIQLIGNTKVIRNQYEYYNLAASNKTPIFIHTHVKIEAGFPDPLLEMSVVLSAVSGNGVAGISENSKKDFIVYPNPAKNEMIISNLSASAKVSIVDLSGRTYAIVNSGTNKFDISNLASGVYIVKIESDGTIFTEQLIKE